MDDAAQFHCRATWGRRVTAPVVKGWCPGAYRPMMSGDGLIVRVRPRGGRLSAREARGLADVADRYGNGVLDLTSRANLQNRGVREEAHDALLNDLAALGLLDEDPLLEARRNILVAPFWTEADETCRLVHALTQALPQLPELPAKVGFAVDTGPRRVLADASADIRIERAAEGGLLVRADGLGLGRYVTEAEVIPAVLDMSAWLAPRITPDTRRMAAVVARETPPDEWQTAEPATTQKLAPGPTPHGAILGAAFGQIETQALLDLLEVTRCTGLRFLPGRMFLLEGVTEAPEGTFLTDPGSAYLTTNACPGAPLCAHASVETRALARALAPRVGGDLHVSGCAKGCAHPGKAALTLVGRDGRFDLVRDGCSWDEPAVAGLSPENAARLTG